MRTDSKAYRILQMHKSGATFASIALSVGVSPTYCRVVVTQRGEAGRSVYDDRYAASAKGLAARAASNARNKKKSSAYGSAWRKTFRQTGSVSAARIAGRTAYDEVRHGADRCAMAR